MSSERSGDENGQYKIHDEPPVITDDSEAVEAARDLGYEITKVDNGN